MIFELVITPFFWILLYSRLPRKGWWIGDFGEALDHFLPLTCLLIEYMLCSNLPFVRRHFIFIALISMVYLSINCWYSLNYKPVYLVMTWKGFMGFLVPLGTVLTAGAIFFTMERVSKYRLQRAGHNKVVDILQGQRHK